MDDDDAARRDSPQGRGHGDRYPDVQSARDDTAPGIDDIADPVIVISNDGTLRFANIAAEQVLDWDREDFIGTSVLDLVHPDDLNLALVSMETVVRKEAGELIALRARTGRGTWQYLEIRGHAADIGGEEMIVLVARDTTDRNRLALDRNDPELLRSVLANMHGMVLLVDENGRIQTINGAITRQLGYDPETIRGRRFYDLVHEDDREQVIDAWRSVSPDRSRTLDARFLAASRTPIVCEFTVKSLVNDPVVRAYVFSGHVATALTDARRRVDFLAEHDARTGLLNRDGFMRAANELIRGGGGLGLMVIDIAHFRSINELYGEPVGDRVLAAVASRIDQVRGPDLVTARFGNDEFVMAVRSSSADTIASLRDRVWREVARPIVIDDVEINIAVRTALAYEARPEVLDSLLVTASNELTAMKRHAGPDPSGSISFDAIEQRRRQVDQLRQALDNGEVRPFFQPIVDGDGRVTAVEALVRWVHPVRGVLGSGEILPLAQMAGLAEAIDDKVLEMSLRFAVELAENGHPEIEVHVNVDPKVVAQPSFGALFLERCNRIGARPSQLVVEITETDLLAPGQTSLSNMQMLRRAGIHVSIDDFGTGYSSLAHLLELPVDGVKIDRRFVAGIDVDPAATNLTTAILGLSESLRLGCVAEGVEQPYQRDRLVDLGCGSFQGWLYARAMPADELLTMLPRIVPPVDAGASTEPDATPSGDS